jgi:hypothetical protein
VLKRRRHPFHTVAQCGERGGTLGRRRSLVQAAGLGVKEQLGPLCSRKRPFVLFTQLKFLSERSAQVEPNARLLIPAVLLALEVVIEETLLQRHLDGQVEPLLMATGMPRHPRVQLDRAARDERLKVGQPLFTLSSSKGLVTRFSLFMTRHRVERGC